MISLSHLQNGTASGSASVSPANTQVVSAIAVGVAAFAASVLMTTPIAQAAAPAILALIAAATVFASGTTSDRGTIAAALVAVVAILGVQLAPTTEVAELSRMALGTVFGGLVVTAGRLITHRV